MRLQPREEPVQSSITKRIYFVASSVRKSVWTYVERRPPVPLTLRQVDPLIRQLTLYVSRTAAMPERRRLTS